MVSPDIIHVLNIWHRLDIPGNCLSFVPFILKLYIMRTEIYMELRKVIWCWDADALGN